MCRSTITMIPWQKYRTLFLAILGIFVFAFLVSFQYIVSYKGPFVKTLSEKDKLRNFLINLELLETNSSSTTARAAYEHHRSSPKSSDNRVDKESFTTTSSKLTQLTRIKVINYQQPISNSTKLKGLFNETSPRKVGKESDLTERIPEATGSKSVDGLTLKTTVNETKYINPNNDTATQIPPKLLHIPGLETLKSVIPVTAERRVLLENPHLCSSVRDLSVLVIVHTAPAHFERRQNMRRTWTNNTYFHNLGKGQVRVLFLLGRVKDTNTQKRLEAEFQQNGDLLQGDFLDAYRNLTLKGVMAYKWISARCRNAKMILKVDDDVLANTYKVLTEYLPEFEKAKRTIRCNHILTGTMPIIREKNNKWFVSQDQFRGHKFYPKYCSGFAVMISADLPPELHSAAFRTPFFWVDDVYLYGLLPGQLNATVTYKSLAGRFSLNSNTAIQCLQNTTKSCPYVIAGGADANIIDTIWDLMTKQYIRESGKQVEVTASRSVTLTSTSISTSEAKTSGRKVEQLIDQMKNILLKTNGKNMEVALP